jgi:hypothetical protein
VPGLALLTRSFGQRLMKGCDTFTVPRRAQAAGRIYLPETWGAVRSVSITTCRVITFAMPELGHPLKRSLANPDPAATADDPSFTDLLIALRHHGRDVPRGDISAVRIGQPSNSQKSSGGRFSFTSSARGEDGVQQVRDAVADIFPR